MTLFDLMFLAAALATLVVLITAFVLLIRRRGGGALRILRGWAISFAAYVAIGLIVSLVRPAAIRAPGEPWCMDDWCLTMQKAQITATPEANTYRVDLLLHSRAGRVSQRAKGAWLYLIDAQGRRFAADPDASAVPLDVLLHPQESIATSRTFRLPAGAHAVGLVTGHGSPYCGVMSFAVIGDSGCLFHKPPMIRIE